MRRDDNKKAEMKAAVVQAPADLSAAYKEKKDSGFTLMSADEVSSWVTSSTELGKKASEYYGVEGWKTPDAALVTQIEKQLESAPKVRQFFEANRSRIENGDTVVNEINNFITSLETLRDGGKQQNELFAQFENADMYNEAVRVSGINGMSSAEIQAEMDRTAASVAPYQTELDAIEKQISDIRNAPTLGGRRPDYSKLTDLEHRATDLRAKISELDKSGIAYTTADGQNVTWQQLYDTKKRQEEFDALYAGLSANSDWASAIENATNYVNPSVKEIEGGMVVFGKVIGGTDAPVNKVTYYEQNQQSIMLGEVNGGGSSIVDSRLVNMTQREKDIYHYYFGKGDYAQADQYLDSLLNGVLKTRDEERMVKVWGEIADAHPVFSSAASVLFSMTSGAEYIADSIEYIKSGKVDTNVTANVSSAIRGTVSEKVDLKIGNWDAFDFVYNTGMSMADSAASMVTFGQFGGIALGLSAAAQGTNDALKRGMSEDQAFWNGFFSGVFEGVFEKLSIGQFSALKKSAASGVKDLAKNIGKSMLVNASEEALTELANIAYDVVVNGDFSSYETSIRQKMTFEGMTEDEAKFAASLELGGRVAESAASGALMGFGFGAGGSAISMVNTSAVGKTLNAQGMGEPLIALGQTMEDGSAAQKFASELATKSKVSDADVGKLYGLIAEQAQDMTPAQILEKAKEARGEYRVIGQDVTSAVTDADVEAFRKATGMDVTAEDLTGADVEVDEDSALVQAAHAEREAGGIEYTPPKAKDIKAYSTDDTKVYSKALSRTVYMYDGASHARAEAGFAENGVVYINKNAPVNRNTVAVVLAHEYTHTIEGTDAYTKLADTVFKSAAYSRMLATAGRNGEGVLQEEYLQQIIEDYAANNVTINTEGAKKEAIAKFLSEYVLQDVNTLMELARTDRTWFGDLYAQFRRYIARLRGKLPNNRELVKIERLFAKAAKAANSGAVAQKSPATTSGVQYMSKSESENSSIKQQLREHSEEIANMDPVAVVSYKPQNKKELRGLAVEEFKKFGYRVDRPNFGIIEIGEKQIEHSLEYINTDAEKAALLTVPRVLKRGKVIDGHPDHKGRAYGTVTIAAPVKINGKVGNVAAVVRQTGKNAYYTHRILMPDGSEFVFENTNDAEPTSLDMPVGNDGQGPSISSASDYSIPDSSQKSNTQYSLPSDAAYMDAVNRGDMDTAQRMVDEAARAAGYPVKAYHGTSNGGFTSFDTYGGRFGLFGKGSYFTENKAVADSYQDKGRGNNKQTYAVYLAPGETLDMDAAADVARWIDAVPDAEEYFDECVKNEDCFKQLKEFCADEGMVRWEAEELITDAISYTMGYSAITHIGGGRFNKNDDTRHRVYIIFEPEQAKSADPVTYDDTGNVIPLSQRFDSEKTDIRYSLPTASKATNVWSEREKRIDRYDQRSYTNYGWVIANGVLSDSEYTSLNKQFAEARQHGYYYPQNNSEEYMITVGDIYSFKDDKGRTLRMQHANKIVFVSGTVQNPIISKVVEVDYAVADDVSYYVEGVIENEQYGIDYIAFVESIERKTIFRTYEREDFPSYSELRRTQQDGRSVQNRNANRGDQQQRRRSGSSSDGSSGVKYSLSVRPAPDASSVWEGDVERADLPKTDDGKLVDSQYIEKVLADPTVSEETKEWLRQNPTKYEVYRKAKQMEDARAIIADENGIKNLVQMIADGHVPDAAEMTALQLMQDASRSGETQGRAVQIAAMGARRVGQALGSITHHKVKNYGDKAPAERRAALIGDYKQDAVQQTFDLQNKFIDRKYHRGAGDFIDSIVLKFGVMDGVKDMDVDALAEATIKMVRDTADGSIDRSRVKQLIIKKLGEERVKRDLHRHVQEQGEMMDALRLTLNKALGIRSMTTSELQTALGEGERIGKLLDNMYAAETEEEAAEIQVQVDAEIDKLFDYVCEHLTITGTERLNSWRKTAMLANVKTHFRNVLSNFSMNGVTGYGGVKAVDDAVATLLERFFVKDHASRSRYVGWAMTAHGKSIMDEVKKQTTLEQRRMNTALGYANDSSSNAPTDTEVNPEATAVRGLEFSESQARMRRKMFGDGDNLLNMASALNSRLLEGEDAFSYTRAFKNELGQRMTAAGVTKATEEMIKASREAALYAVFRADNALNDWVVQRLKTGGPQDTIDKTKVMRYVNEAFDGLLPFTKTPSNLLFNLIDHSPMGLVKTLGEVALDLHRGNQIDTTQLIGKLSRNITGTGAAVLGYALAAMGFIALDEPEDWEYDELIGAVPYALRVGNVYISTDWLQPTSGMFLIGAVIADGVYNGQNFFDMFSAVGGLIFDQSYLQSVQQVFDTSDFDDGDYVTALGQNLAKSYITQFIPTLVGQLARTVDPVQRQVSEPGDFGQTMINTVLSRIPFASKLLDPKVSVWGDTLMRNNVQNDFGGYVSNALQQFVSPSTFTGREYSDETTGTLLELYEEAQAARRDIENDDTLTAAEKKKALDAHSTASIFSDGDLGKEWTTVDGEHVTGDEAVADEATALLRRTYKSYLDLLIPSAEFQQADTAKRIGMVGEVYEDVKALYKQTFKTMDTAEAIETFELYHEKVSSGRYDPELVNAYATIKLSDGKPLISNAALCKRYETAVEEIYEARMRKIGGTYTWTKDGVKQTIYTAKATPEEWTFIEDRERELARKDVVRLYGDVDATTLAAELSETDAYTVKSKH